MKPMVNYLVPPLLWLAFVFICLMRLSYDRIHKWEVCFFIPYLYLFIKPMVYYFFQQGYQIIVLIYIAFYPIVYLVTMYYRFGKDEDVKNKLIDRLVMYGVAIFLAFVILFAPKA